VSCQSFKIYFKIKISIKNRTIGYRIIQCVLGFLVKDCVPMDTYMTGDPCENYMFTNNKKAFINFNNLVCTYVDKNERAAGGSTILARLPSASSIFSAEANAILLALKFVASSDKNKFMICSDSLSYLLAIESC
jgi:hypothetical protein